MIFKSIIVLFKVIFFILDVLLNNVFSYFCVGKLKLENLDVFFFGFVFVL